MSALNIQEYLFQRIRERLPADASLADAVAGLLFVSNDSAYRRIRGETPLVLDEAKTLCDAFSLSLDELLQTNEQSVSFSFQRINNKDYNFKNYLQDIFTNLKMVNSVQDKEIIYLSKDIPIFYNFLYQPLFAFRYFFWMKSILQHPDFLSRSFTMNCLPKDIEEIGNNISSVYNNIPSTEIWNTECINSTIAQVEYYREADYFQSSEDIGKIYGAVCKLIEHIRLQADLGKKFLPSENPKSKKNDFHFFHNRVVLGDNTILVRAGGKKYLYLSYDVLNYMVTTNEAFCNDVHRRMEMLMRKATILSNASEKQRNIFFNILLKKIPYRSSIHDNS
ncbi:MAG: hypothetical protein ACJ75B_16620 [Flavisolibacter sp.]